MPTTLDMNVVKKMQNKIEYNLSMRKKRDHDKFCPRFKEDILQCCCEEIEKARHESWTLGYMSGIEEGRKLQENINRLPQNKSW